MIRVSVARLSLADCARGTDLSTSSSEVFTSVAHLLMSHLDRGCALPASSSLGN